AQRTASFQPIPPPRHTSTTNTGPPAAPCVKLAMAIAPKSCTAMRLISPPGSRVRSNSPIQSARGIGFAARAPVRNSKSSVSNAARALASALRTAAPSDASFSRKSLTSLLTIGRVRRAERPRAFVGVLLAAAVVPRVQVGIGRGFLKLMRDDARHAVGARIAVGTRRLCFARAGAAIGVADERILDVGPRDRSVRVPAAG